MNLTKKRDLHSVLINRKEGFIDKRHYLLVIMRFTLGPIPVINS